MWSEIMRGAAADNFASVQAKFAEQMEAFDVELDEVSSEKSADASGEQEETSLQLYKEPTAASGETTGLAYVWLLVSTFLFTLSITLPVYIILAGLIALLTFALFSAVLFTEAASFEMANGGLGILGGLCLVAGIGLIAALRYSLGFSDDERLQKSLRGTLIRWLAILLLLLTLAAWLIDFQSELGASIVLGVVMADTLSILLGFLWFGGRFSWRSLIDAVKHFRTSPFWARAWSMASSLASGLAAFLMVIVWGAMPSALEMASEEDWATTLSSLEEGGSAEQPGWLGRMSAAPSAPSIPDFPTDSNSAARLNECFQTLSGDFGSRNSARARAIRRVQNGGRLNEYDAQDLVQTVILDVCSRHSRHNIDELEPYFSRSVSNAINDVSRSGWSRRCSLEHWDLDGGDFRPPQHDMAQMYDVKRILCRRLSQEEREVLLLAAEGKTGPEIARELRISSSAARKRLERARSSLVASLEE
jgi:RNA polymerase sigma factor (sigma-70 family)